MRVDGSKGSGDFPPFYQWVVNVFGQHSCSFLRKHQGLIPELDRGWGQPLRGTQTDYSSLASSRGWDVSGD